MAVSVLKSQHKRYESTESGVNPVHQGGEGYERNNAIDLRRSAFRRLPFHEHN